MKYLEELVVAGANFVWGTPLLITLLGGGIFFMFYSSLIIGGLFFLHLVRGTEYLKT